MGGCPDGEGSIDANLLIKVIKGEFELTIDIEKIIKDLDADKSGQVTYDEFRKLLAATDLMGKR